jgi:hypothetical protein
MRKCLKLLALLCFLLFSGIVPKAARSQSLMGTTGLVTIPTARMQQDGTVSLGLSYFDKKHQQFFEGTSDIGMAYLNVTLLPFLELAMRLNNPFPSDDFSVDRTPMVRLRLLKERKFLPAVVVGVHDLASTESTSTVHYNATYLVFSKQWKEFDFHLGYAPEIMKARYYQLSGVFGGVAYSPHRAIHFSAEYDTRHVNAGVELLLWKHLGINLGTINFDSWAAGVSFKACLQ